jgi:hypothetical protein
MCDIPRAFPQRPYSITDAIHNQHLQAVDNQRAWRRCADRPFRIDGEWEVRCIDQRRDFVAQLLKPFLPFSKLCRTTFATSRRAVGHPTRQQPRHRLLFSDSFTM